MPTGRGPAPDAAAFGPAAPGSSPDPRAGSDPTAAQAKDRISVGPPSDVRQKQMILRREDDLTKVPKGKMAPPSPRPRRQPLPAPGADADHRRRRP